MENKLFRLKVPVQKASSKYFEEAWNLNIWKKVGQFFCIAKILAEQWMVIVAA